MRENNIIIACEVVAKELNARIPMGLPVHLVDPALHVNPDRLRKALQDAIYQEERRYNTLLLGFGLCSRAVEGLRSEKARMVIPLVDDCIGIFLGSRAAHLDQINIEPGTFFLSRGWIDAGITPFEEYDYMVKRFGSERAERFMHALLKNYTRLVFIDTGCRDDAREYRRYAREKAARFGLRYEEMGGMATIFDDLIKAGSSNGTQNELLIVPPGEEIVLDMFIVKNRQCSTPAEAVSAT